MVAYFFPKFCTSALLIVLALAATTAPGYAHNNDTAPAPDVAADGVLERGLKSSEEYWSHGKDHHKHLKCRASFTKADITKTRRYVQPCGFPSSASCPCERPPYRQFSGACNNRRNAGLGTATSLYNRVLRARYADGVNEVVTSRPSGRLPKARRISETIFKDKDRKDHIYSMMLMEWGELITHDVGMRKDITNDSGGPISCCDTKSQTAGRRDRSSAQDSSDEEDKRSKEEKNPACMPVRITRDDCNYHDFIVTCFDVVRSQFKVCSSEVGEPVRVARQSPPRSSESDEDERGNSEQEKKIWRKGRQPPSPKAAFQLNMMSSFLDLSLVYGNSDEENQKLRLGQGGLLKSREVKYKDEWYSSEEDSSSSSSEEGDFREFLPLSRDNVNGCITKKNICYLAGDDRVNKHPWLASMQTLLLREHNRLARRLQTLHPDWDDETLFQEARRILIAMWQLITYRDYLPKIVGKKILKQMGMVISSERRSNYSSQVNPSTLDEFSSGAYRFLHSQIDESIELLDHGRYPIMKLRLSEHILNPSVLEYGHNFEEILRGLSHQAAQQSDRFVTKDLTTGFRDLVSEDILRGRDHGLPSYNAMRDICGLPKAVGFEDFRDVMTGKNIKRLKKLYRSVNDVDLYVGGTLEEHCVDGDDSALVGPTFGCIIAEQFFRWRSGDRYFFDHARGPGAFTEEQYRAINDITLASILCENLDDEKYMQLDPFMRVGHENELKRCKDIPKLNMKPWKNYNLPDGCLRTTTLASTA